MNYRRSGWATAVCALLVLGISVVSPGCGSMDPEDKAIIEQDAGADGAARPGDRTLNLEGGEKCKTTDYPCPPCCDAPIRSAPSRSR